MSSRMQRAWSLLQYSALRCKSYESANSHKIHTQSTNNLRNSPTYRTCSIDLWLHHPIVTIAHPVSQL